MAFKVLFISKAPDADYNKHKSIIDTGKYRLLTSIVKNQEEALKVAKSIYEEEKINALLLCPGFNHVDVAEIFQALQGKVSVSVARGDGPSNQISQTVLEKEYHDK